MVIIGRSILLTAANGFLSISVNPNPLPCARDKYGFEIPASLDKWTENIVIVAVPLANEKKTLLFAAFSGGPGLRNVPPDRYVINFRASYAEETAAMFDALIEIAGLKPAEIAFFTQRDSYGDSGFTLGVTALQRHGLRDPRTALHVGYE